MATTADHNEAEKAALRAEARRLDRSIARISAARKRRDGGGADYTERGHRARVKQDVLGGPFTIRKGENVMGSRGYSYARAAGVVNGAILPEDAKLEMMVAGKLHEAMRVCKGWNSYESGPRGRSIKAPLDPAYLMGSSDGGDIIDQSFGMELKSLMWAGTTGADPDQAEWLSRKYGTPNTLKGWAPDTQKVGGSNQSWQQQNLGGALVPFPEFGPLVPLLRNKNAIMTAGAVTLPLPPSGRITFPRQTAPSLGYHVGEGTKITQSTVNTDQFTLSAKKIGAYIITNNELIRYGGPVVEQMFRNDMTTTLGLTLDFDLLQAGGSDNVPAGLIGYPGVTTFTPTTVATNGNTLSPQDIYTFMGQIRANNANFEGWIIRPELLFAMVGKRASVLASGDNLGLFLFDLTRGFNKLKNEEGYNLGGFGVVDSANVPANRVKGNASNLTALYGGMWSDFRIGIYGTIEIATADQGDNLFPQDQTAVRAILSCDGGPWHPGAFGVADSLLLSTVGT